VVEPRDLLDAGPDGYTAARDAEVKRRRAEGDREGSVALRALGKPGLALWAVLVAAGRPELADAAVDATDRLLDAQRGSLEGGARGALASAERDRRQAIDAVVAAATVALEGAGRAAPDERREELRDIVDRLSRCPDLLPSWKDGTLRDVPEAAGFSAFAGFEVPGRARPPAGRPRSRTTGPPETSSPETSSPATGPPARADVPPAPVAAPRPPAVDARARRAARRELERHDELVRRAERRAAEARERAAEAVRLADEEAAALGEARAAQAEARARLDEIEGGGAGP
jgi:hypothetical protein